MSAIKITQDNFGTYLDPTSKNDQVVLRYTLENENGMSVQLISYGATITSIKVPARDGTISDVVLGYDDISGYRGGQKYFGATIGRVSNRIAKGKFTVDGKEYQLPVNNGPNSLHGGVVGFDKRMWEGKVLEKEGDSPKVVFSLLSQDGDQGYPGDLIAQVTFELTEDNQLKVDYQAMTTKTTPVALTNHSYFNLAGHENASQKLEGHFIEINADHYTPLDDNLVTKGEIVPVKGTIFDLKTMKDLHELLKKFPEGPNGYDNNICLNPLGKMGIMRLAVRLQHKPSGRVLEVHTDQPGIQFYTANFLPGKGEAPIKGKGGVEYWRHGAMCLETQNFPNAVNHKNFPNPLLKPGEVHRHSAIFKFYTVQ